jgi:hypothetical protein
LLSTLIEYKDFSSIANPPITTFFPRFEAASIAYFISSPGMKGWKSVGKALHKK